MDPVVDSKAGPGVDALRIRTELIQILYESATVPLVNAVLIVISAVLLRSIYPTGLLVAWVAVSLAVSGIRQAIWQSFRKLRPDMGRIGRWALLYAIGSATMGTLWGLLEHFPT
jgi:hypothetical protein